MMEIFQGILGIIYFVTAYWAVGQTVYYNKIVLHEAGALFARKLLLAILFGWLLIPVALVMNVIRNKH